jgi:GT2 family glycosyltransferase
MIPVLIVPVLTRYELLDIFISRLDYPIDKLIIIDNGNQKPSPVCPVANSLEVISVPFNLGVAASWNLGIKVSPMSNYWLICNFDIEIPAGNLQRIAEAAKDDAIMLSGVPGRFFCFTIGEKVVERVGLFDEAIYPGYFEDNDYHHRCNSLGVPVLDSGVDVGHINSATLYSSGEFVTRNNHTFIDNQRYFQDKQASGDLSSGEWQIERIRRNRWT